MVLLSSPFFRKIRDSTNISFSTSYPTIYNMSSFVRKNRRINTWHVLVLFSNFKNQKMGGKTWLCWIPDFFRKIGGSTNGTFSFLVKPEAAPKGKHVLVEFPFFQKMETQQNQLFPLLSKKTWSIPNKEETIGFFEFHFLHKKKTPGRNTSSVRDSLRTIFYHIK